MINDCKKKKFWENIKKQAFEEMLTLPLNKSK